MARVTSAKDNDIYAWQDASGMYRVKFDADRDDKKQGMGKYTFTSGAEYVGITIDGKKEGHGKYTLADGTYFDGEWKDNKSYMFGA